MLCNSFEFHGYIYEPKEIASKSVFNLLNPSYLQNEKKICIFYKLEDIIYRERCQPQVYGFNDDEQRPG